MARQRHRIGQRQPVEIGARRRAVDRRRIGFGPGAGAQRDGGADQHVVVRGRRPGTTGRCGSGPRRRGRSRRGCSPAPPRHWPGCSSRAGRAGRGSRRRAGPGSGRRAAPRRRRRRPSNPASPSRSGRRAATARRRGSGTRGAHAARSGRSRNPPWRRGARPRAPRAAAAPNARPGPAPPRRAACRPAGRRASSLARTDSIRAASATLRAIGPSVGRADQPRPRVCRWRRGRGRAACPTMPA